MEYRTYNVTLPECGYYEDMDIDYLCEGEQYGFDCDNGSLVLDDDEVVNLIAYDTCGEAINSDEFVYDRFECDSFCHGYSYSPDTVRVVIEGHYEIKDVRLLTEESFNELPYWEYDTYKDYVVDTIQDLLDEKYRKKWNARPWVGFDYRAYDRFELEGDLDGYYQGILIEEVK